MNEVTENFKLKIEPIPSFGDLMTISEFVGNVEAGGFIDYDGHGYLAYEDRMSNIVIVPSETKNVLDRYKVLDFTHVVWFNR